MLRIRNNNKNQRKMTEIKVNKERARKKKERCIIKGSQGERKRQAIGN